jgi:nitroimidazol reductase NimA-like FMN-containing flavoprotein (pyridoxamine 5'-phosphate oxidase superfamily)
VTPPPRSAERRKQDSLHRLERDVDAWVATADGGGTPYLIPLSFLWDGATLLVATPSSSPTGRNLRTSGRVRVGVGLTRDVVLIEGTVEAIADTEIPDEVGDAFAAKAGFDPRELAGSYHYFRIRPRRLQAWREVDELEGRDLLRDGAWLVPG